MDPNNGVYDKDDREPVTKPDLLSQEEGKRPDQDKEGGLFNPDGDKKNNKALGSSALGRAEAGSPGKKLGKGYNDKASSPSLGGRIAGVIRNPKARRRALIIGGSGGGLATLLAIFVFMSAGLRIETLVNRVQQHFEATTMSAVSDETENIFSNYIAKHVLPSYKGCGTTISKDCSVNNIIGTNPVDNLYRTWANARLENKLAEDYGIEFKYDKASKTWLLKAPGLASEGEKIGENGEELASVFKKADQSALRGAISDALENETKWQQILGRYKYGRLLEEKYGVKRCLIFCGTRDALQNHSNEKKNAAQIFLTQRVLIPRTDTLGIVMECLLDPNCNAESTQPTTAEDGSTGELAGEAENPETDTAVRYHLAELASSYGITDEATINSMIEDYDHLEKSGYSNYALEAVLEKIGLSDLSENITNAAPLIGWASTASRFIGILNKSGPEVKKLAYLTNSAAAVSLYMMYRSYADEIHTGHIDATELGSMSDSLGPGNGASNEIGGTATAEQTPLYNSIVNGGSSSSSPSSVSLLNNILPSSTAYADSTSSTFSSYKCANGKPVSAGQLVCSEEKIGGGNALLNSVHTTLNTPPLSFITSIASAWNSVPGKLLGFIGNIFGSVLNGIPGVSNLVHDASSFVSGIAQHFFTFLTNQLVPDPFGTNMSGGRTYDLMAMGADASYSSYGQTGIGGRALSPTEVATIDNQQTTEEQRQFSHESIFARLFDTNSTYSLISKLAVDMPTNLQSGTESSLASLISRPLSLLSDSFGALFSSKVSAAESPQPDPFRITQYGYTQADLNAIGDAGTYWNEHCSDNPSQAYQNTNQWNTEASQTPDPNTGMPENTTTNPCLLIETTVGSAGGLFNTSLLASDDLADTSQTTTSSSVNNSSSSELTNPFPQGWTPNRLDMGYDGTFSGQIVAPFSGTITYASSSFSNWGGYIEFKADNQPNGLSTSTLYFAEGVKPINSQESGQHVNAGQPIANPAISPYGNAYGTTSDGSGQIEWGVAADGTVGSPTNPLAETGISNPSQMVLNFAQWAEQSLGVAAPLTTNHAGYP